MAFPEVQRSGNPREVPGQSPSWKRVALALFVFLTGAGSIIAGVAFIYWPAGLIVAGLLIGCFGAMFINVTPPREGDE